MPLQRRWINKQVNSAEEDAVLAADPPALKADGTAAAMVDVYFVAAPVRIEMHTRLSELSEAAAKLGSLSNNPALGHAAKAVPEDKQSLAPRIVWMWNWPANPATATNPSMLWIMAHELGHTVGRLSHSIDGLPESKIHPGHVRNSDNEMRLMTGRDGPKRNAGPDRLIKYEWDQLHQFVHFNR